MESTNLQKQKFNNLKIIQKNDNVFFFVNINETYSVLHIWIESFGSI